ncbi:MAG: hypothetical protein LBU82_03615 [Treponema sp.]|jgi:ABC-type glycerol-3-phosphate transport system substrate-binding protein|nr:hypothetical protein [Treponema sp.]
MRFSIGLGFVLLAQFATLSCNGNKVALVWTDRPEFAIYGEYFNTAQNQYKVTTRYYDYPVSELERALDNPDIIVGSWLKNTATEAHFKPIDNLFGAKKLARSVFYAHLLAFGRIERNQYLLPVSFNAPAFIFSRRNSLEFSNPFTIGFDEVKTLSKAFNAENNGVFSRMGFSPLWSDDFLYTAAVLHGASFREGLPLTWDAPALDSSLTAVYDWTHEINTDNKAEEDFKFKYFFEPPEKLIQSGRILFSYIESDALFTLSEDLRRNLDFRWIAEKSVIPLSEDAVYMGMPKKGKAAKAAAAFINWFFQAETQQKLLEESRADRLAETVFGVCGGFSSLSAVTEQVFPRFYPGLLGRMPPSENLEPALSLPADWPALKDRIVLPYLHDRARKRNSYEVYPLEKRISDWQRVNR